MTMIVDYPTKKALKEAVANGPEYVQVIDPSLMPEWRKYGATQFSLDAMKAGDSIVVTNHPKRSWFAEIVCKGNGVFKVS